MPEDAEFHDRGRKAIDVLRAAGMSEKGQIIVISGPSGVGKGTLMKEIMRLRPDFSESISITTREPRPGELEGVDYYFRTHEEFKDLLARGEILEHDEFDGNFYGTPAKALRDASKEGNNIILEITVAGAVAVKKMFPSAISVFLLPPDLETLKCRLAGRGTQSAESLAVRLKEAESEIMQASRFDYLIINDDLERAVEDLETVIKAESFKYSHLQGLESKILQGLKLSRKEN